MYGRTNELDIGSGLFVGHEGVSVNHHFVPTTSFTKDEFLSSKYSVEIHAVLLGDKNPILLQRFQFEIGEEESLALRTAKDKAVFYIWDQQTQIYKSRIDARRSKGRSVSVSGSGAAPFSWE